ncbi:MAG: hypothetical protein ACRYFX_13295 [Janthinobacterium lividum]
MSLLFAILGSPTVCRLPQRLLLASSLGLGALTLDGCCWEACIGQNTKYIEVQFQLSTDTLSGAGFMRAQVQQVRLVQYADQQLAHPTDTVAYAKGQQGKAFHFAGGARQLALTISADSLGRHPAYRVLVGGQHFDVNQLQPETDVEKPCNCLYLKNVRFTLNNVGLVVPQTGGAPTPIVLHK